MPRFVRLTVASVTLAILCTVGLVAQQGPPPIGSAGTTVTGTSPIVVTGSAISCPTCGTGSGNASTTNPLSQFAATTSAQLAGVISNETGTGLLVFGTNPVLTTPNLGVPSAITLTNGTGLPISTGVSGLGTGVATFLGTPSSANLATALADGTGSGSAVFATSPTLVTPALGTPSALVLTNATGLNVTACATCAPLASPSLTGTPLAPTAAADTNTTQIASTAYVVGQGYAKLASPTLTGTPLAPTAAVSTNTTQLATTAFVLAQAAAPGAIGSTTPSTGAFTTISGTGVATFSAAGATSANSVKYTGTLLTGGTGTTNFPHVFIDPGVNTAPTTWSVNGTLLGMNAPTGFTGKFVDFHLNGASSAFSVDQTGGVSSAGITSSGTILSAAGSALGFNGRSRSFSAADGRVNYTNTAGSSLSITRFTFGTEAATNPAFAPLSTILDVVDGAGTATLGNTTLVSANGNKTFVTTNFTTAANTSLQTITGLTFNFPAVAHNWSYSCHLAYSQGTANAAVAFGIVAATNNPTNIFSTGIQQITVGPPATVVTGTLATLATTTGTAIVSGTPTATATNYYVELGGTLELGASANAVSIQVSTATSADAVTVLRGSSCQVF